MMQYFAPFIAGLLLALHVSTVAAQTENLSIYYSNEFTMRSPDDTAQVLKYQYQRTNGRLTGNFTAYYRDKKIKAQGRLENGQPAGEWRVYFPDGKLAMKRLYHRPGEFEILFPALPKKGPAALFGKNTLHPINRDSNGVCQWLPVKEKDIYWEKRLFRWVPADANNRVLFENNRLMKALWPAILSGEIKVYSDQKFRAVSPTERFSNLDLSEQPLLGIEIKEVCFFDKFRLDMYSRILGICPVLKDPVSGDTLRPFWIYYPAVRSYLARIKPAQNLLPPNAENLDDIFYLRHFSGVAYAEINNYSKQETDFTPSASLQEDADKRDLDILNFEYECWVLFNSSAKEK